LIIRISLWSLVDTQTTLAELREYVRDEAVPAFERVRGLLFKAWVSDEATGRFGAVYVFESLAAAEQELPSRAAELIGKPPDLVEVFDVDATISVAPELARLGLVFEGT
jgi:hypothetical protein